MYSILLIILPTAKVRFTIVIFFFFFQDVIVTNHILLMFLDSAMKLPEYNGSTNMLDHIRQYVFPSFIYFTRTLRTMLEKNMKMIKTA